MLWYMVMGNWITMWMFSSCSIDYSNTMWYLGIRAWGVQNKRFDPYGPIDVDMKQSMKQSVKQLRHIGLLFKYSGWTQYCDSYRCIIDLRFLESSFWGHPFSRLIDQKPNEGGMVATCPNVSFCFHAHIHLVTFLQVQDCCISSVISWVRAFVISCAGNDIIVTIQWQPWLL